MNDDKLGAAAAVPNSDDDVAKIRDEISRTRSGLDQTIGELHGRLNPEVLKDRALEQFGEAKSVVVAHMNEAKEGFKVELKEAKEGLKSELKDAKDGLKAELKEVKDNLKSELLEAKDVLKSEFKEAKDSLKAEVLAEVADAKAALREATIGKVEHMVTKAEDSVKQTSRSLLGTIQENPIPAALAGVGIAWLIYNARASKSRAASSNSYSSGAYTSGSYGSQRGQSLENRVGGALIGVRDVAREKLGSAASTVEHEFNDVAHKASDVAHRASDFASGIGDTISHGVDDVRQRAGSLAHDVTDSLGHVAHDVTDSLGNVVSRAGRTAHDARDAMGNVVDATGQKLSSAAHVVGDKASEAFTMMGDQGKAFGRSTSAAYDVNPMAFGLGALALGAAVGMSLPSTRQEDEWLGETRDQAMKAAEKLAHGALGKISDATHGLGETAAHALESSLSADKSDADDKKDGKSKSASASA